MCIACEIHSWRYCVVSMWKQSRGEDVRNQVAVNSRSRFHVRGIRSSSLHLRIWTGEACCNGESFGITMTDSLMFLFATLEHPQPDFAFYHWRAGALLRTIHTCRNGRMLKRRGGAELLLRLTRETAVSQNAMNTIVMTRNDHLSHPP